MARAGWRRRVGVLAFVSWLSLGPAVSVLPAAALVRSASPTTAGVISTYAGGPAPASEPETKALLALLTQLQPSRILSIHCHRTDPCNNFDGPAEGLASVMAGHNGYPVRDSIGYPTPGSLGSFAGVDRRIPTITLELPARQPTPRSWAQNREALVAAIRADDRTVRAGSGSPPPPAPPDAAPEEALGR